MRNEKLSFRVAFKSQVQLCSTLYRLFSLLANFKAKSRSETRVNEKKERGRKREESEAASLNNASLSIEVLSIDTAYIQKHSLPTIYLAASSLGSALSLLL